MTNERVKRPLASCQKRSALPDQGERAARNIGAAGHSRNLINPRERREDRCPPLETSMHKKAKGYKHSSGAARLSAVAIILAFAVATGAAQGLRSATGCTRDSGHPDRRIQ
jgi:hypothetical protein